MILEGVLTCESVLPFLKSEPAFAKNICDVCGSIFGAEINVLDCRDGIRRCNYCRRYLAHNLAIHGKSVRTVSGTRNYAWKPSTT